MKLPLSLAAAVLLLCGCVNLKAISDYADSASSVVGDTAPAARWRDSEAHLQQMRLEGDMCPIGRTQRKPQADFDAAFAEVAKVHGTLAQYFDALAKLASDQVPLPKQAAQTKLDAIKSLGVPVSDQEEASVNALSALLSHALDAYRQRELRTLMDRTQDDVERTLTVLQRLARVYVGEVEGEEIQAVGFLKCSMAAGDLTDKFSGRRQIAKTHEDYHAQIELLKKYEESLAKIQKEHEQIRDALTLNRETLADTLRSIAAAARELEATRQSLSQL